MVKGGNRLFEARWLVCKIGTNDGLRSDAACGDREYHFGRIVELATEAEFGARKFMYSMEFAAILHFVIRKWDEKIRHDALTLFKRACCARTESPNFCLVTSRSTLIAYLAFTS